MNEPIYTHRTTDLRRKLCKCCSCGKIERCTPMTDFYGEKDEPVQCEVCMLNGVGIKKPMLHMIQADDGPVVVSKEIFVKLVEADEESNE